MSWVLLAISLFACVQLAELRCDCTEKVVLLLDDDDTFRIVKSPDYPRKYCGGMNCTWRVVSSTNNSKIYFYAEKIDLREGQDFIEFYDQKYLSVPLNATHRCTGSGESCSYSTDSKIMTIRFISDLGDIDNVGFQGVVSGYDKRWRELRDIICRYVVIPTGLFILLTILVISYCCYKKRSRRNHEYSKAPTSDRHNDLTQ